jgi:23S rRNA (uracil1939-C5)-methyltransferase
VTDTLLDLNFQISPKSFYQINKRQTEVLYQCAGDMANLSESDVVLDAYCGTGTIGSTLANRVKAVVGVELNKDAVADAKRNAKENDLQNIRFICKDAGEYLEGLAQKKSELSDDEIPTVVVMDPPRSGSSKAFLNSLLKLKPERVVYISCGPESLKRDLEYLLRPKHGKRLYRVEKIQPVDMFPMTKHVETVALLSKN